MQASTSRRSDRRSSRRVGRAADSARRGGVVRANRALSNRWTSGTLGFLADRGRDNVATRRQRRGPSRSSELDAETIETPCTSAVRPRPTRTARRVASSRRSRAGRRDGCAAPSLGARRRHRRMVAASIDPADADRRGDAGKTASRTARTMIERAVEGGRRGPASASLLGLKIARATTVRAARWSASLCQALFSWNDGTARGDEKQRLRLRNRLGDSASGCLPVRIESLGGRVGTTGNVQSGPNYRCRS